MTQIVKADSAAAMLALAPYLIGHEPRNSLVFITFAGKRSQAVLRINLPTSTNPAVLKRIATQSLGTLCKVPGIDAILPIVYTDDEFGLTAPYRLLVDILIALIRTMGFEVRGALCRASDGWASYFDQDVPAGGRPLDELTAPADLPALELRFERPEDADLAEKDAISNRVSQLRAMFEENPDADQFEALNDITLFLDAALYWEAEGREEFSALLLALLQAPAIRDKTMVQWSTSLEFSDAHWENDSELADRMMGHGSRPDRDRIDAAIALLGYLLALAHDELRPAPLCMLAWLHWTQGRSSAAGDCIAEVLAIDPQYGMGQLLGNILSAGMLPEWLFESPTR